MGILRVVVGKGRGQPEGEPELRPEPEEAEGPELVPALARAPSTGIR